MRKGFIFNTRLCVSCKACNAACMVENGWGFNARRIFTHNPDAFSTGQVVNVSMACNHCQDPVCMTGCPTSAYSRNPETGAVLPVPERCIGCRYCTWNCPYDAPRYNEKSGIIEKCHFCNHLIIAGASPACSSACPTGALGFGDIPDTIDFTGNSIVPEKGINPSYYFSETVNGNNPEVIPRLSNENPDTRTHAAQGMNPADESLVVFSFLSMLSVSLTVSNTFVFNGLWYKLPLILILIACLSSLFHLGSKIKAWRSLTNLRHSPLSREISALLLYVGLLFCAPFADSPVFQIITSFAGLILLLSIDSVYNFTSGRIARFHSGQVFISSLLVVSFLTRQTIPFLFVAGLKLIIIFRAGQLTEKERTLFGHRFIRVALLVITAAILITGASKGEISSLLIFLAGEFIDRYLFYCDFLPLNITTTINNKINIPQDEKKHS